MQCDRGREVARIVTSACAFDGRGNAAFRTCAATAPPQKGVRLSQCHHSDAGRRAVGFGKLGVPNSHGPMPWLS
eukprot:3021599-Lingulodinium_polyedra.AAC.1